MFNIEREVEPIKQVLIIEQYYDLKWLVPTTKNHIIKIEKHDNVNWALIKRWCEQNCKDTVAIWTTQTSPTMDFYFFSEIDLMAFKLRWA